MLLLLLLLLIAAPCGAQSETEVADDQGGVHVGVYVNRIYGVDTRGGAFNADFWIWFRWTDPELDPLKSFEIVNGAVESCEGEYRSEWEGSQYAACRVTAALANSWDASRFPFDDHHLVIEVEDAANEEDALKYVADTDNSAIDPRVQLPGWSVADHYGMVQRHTYATNYGDLSIPTGSKSIYSRYSYTIHARRQGYGVFTKTFFGMFISVLIAFLAFMVKPTDLDPRFGLGLGAIFAAVASEYVVVSILPQSAHLTLADLLHIIAFSFIFLSLGESCFALRLYNQGKEAEGDRLDRICGPIFLVVYLALTVAAIAFA
jgi:hypothetical protein